MLDQLEAPVSVQGRERYVMMTQEQYQYLRECELKIAISESKADLARAHIAKETVAQHMKHLQKMNHFPK